jgi:hypothetical protein
MVGFAKRKAHSTIDLSPETPRMPAPAAILNRFPGPVLLPYSRKRAIFTLIVAIAGCAISIWVIRSGDKSLYDTIVAPIALLVFVGLGGRSLILLFRPATASLTLDAKGVQIRGLLRNERFLWRDVSGFRPAPGPRTFSFDVVVIFVHPDNPGEEPVAVTSMSDGYGFSVTDLANLLNEWRERALAASVARSATKPTGPIRTPS